jgi:CO/xanthine dehydrogenase Mo-binding subunit
MKDQDHLAEYTSARIFAPLYNRPLSIGAAVVRPDAHEKVTGQTKYAADYYSKNMLWTGVKRAGVPHARLKGVETDQAAQVPGVVRILTHKDISGANRQGVIKRDQPVLVDDKVRHCGDAVALVIAETKASLRKALDLIRLDLALLSAVTNAEQALENDSPLVHEDNAEGNVLLKGDLKIG